MVVGKRGKAGKRGAGRGKGRRGGKARAQNVRDQASLSENRTFVVPGGNQPVANQMYSLLNTTLAQFFRAPTVAQGYQFYKIKRIALKIKPQFDTFFSGAPNSYGKPKLYYMLDKSGSLPTTVTLEMLKQMGAKPHNLDEKPLVISWAPSVLTSDLTNTAPVATQAAQYKISPWLSTSDAVIGTTWNPSSVDHLGVYWYVESTSYGGTGGMPYQIDVEVQFMFKKPLIESAGTTTPAISVVPAVIDNSPDGIEGGSDGITLRAA